MRWKHLRENLPEKDKAISNFVALQQGELTRKIAKILKDNHTQEELNLLKNGYWGVGIYDVLNNIGLDYLRRLYVLAQQPTEDLPLYINDEDRFTKQYVCWRLKVGK